MKASDVTSDIINPRSNQFRDFPYTPLLGSKQMLRRCAMLLNVASSIINHLQILPEVPTTIVLQTIPTSRLLTEITTCLNFWTIQFWVTILFQWIGLRENLQETTVLPSNIGVSGVSCKFSHHPTLWLFEPCWVPCLLSELPLVSMTTGCTASHSWPGSTIRWRGLWGWVLPPISASISWLVVSTCFNPFLQNISQMGLFFPIYGKRKTVPNHQPGMAYEFSCWLYHIGSDCGM